jgi:hypothetical protein
MLEETTIFITLKILHNKLKIKNILYNNKQLVSFATLILNQLKLFIDINFIKKYLLLYSTI